MDRQVPREEVQKARCAAGLSEETLRARRHMRVLLDTDVLMDVALKREPFFAKGARVIQWAQETPGKPLLRGIPSRTSPILFVPMHAGSWKTAICRGRSH